MRIAFDARYLTQAASGIGTYCQNLLTAMLSLDPGLEALLVVRKENTAARIDPVRCREMVLDVEPRSLRTLYHLPRMLRRHSCALFHGPFNILPSGLERPTVVTVHDLMQLQNPGNIATSFWVQNTAGLFWRTRIRHAIDNADRVIAVSEATRDAILERFPEKDPAEVVVTPQGVDPFFLEPPQQSELEAGRRRIGHEGPFVLCVGNESPHKNHYRAVEAFVKAHGAGSPTKLVLVRRMVRRDPRTVELLSRPQVSSRVIVLDQVDRPVLRALYHLAELFFFPSWVEGFGLPILEAMSCRCPVLTSDRSAPREVAGDAAWCVSPFDVDAMAYAIRRLGGDAARRKELAERGFQRAQTFTWQQCAEGTLAVYRTLVGN